MTTTPDTRNYAVEHFETDVQPGNIIFYPTCRVCGGRLRFDYYNGELAYRHAPEDRDE